MKELTRAEEQVMQILWKKEKAFVKELIEDFNEPKPAYSTVSTIIRILEKKGFVSHIAYGKNYQYYPVVKKPDYTKSFFNGFLKNYFSSSFKQMLSFFSKQENMSVHELEELKKMMEEEIENKQKNEDIEA